jgi:hypothetical protein
VGRLEDSGKMDIKETVCEEVDSLNLIVGKYDGQWQDPRGPPKTGKTQTT